MWFLIFFLSSQDLWSLEISAVIINWLCQTWTTKITNVTGRFFKIWESVYVCICFITVSLFFHFAFQPAILSSVFFVFYINFLFLHFQFFICPFNLTVNKIFFSPPISIAFSLNILVQAKSKWWSPNYIGIIKYCVCML